MLENDLFFTIASNFSSHLPGSIVSPHWPSQDQLWFTKIVSHYTWVLSTIEFYQNHEKKSFYWGYVLNVVKPLVVTRIIMMIIFCVYSFTVLWQLIFAASNHISRWLEYWQAWSHHRGSQTQMGSTVTAAPYHLIYDSVSSQLTFS